MDVLNEIKIWKDHWYFRLIKRIRPVTIHTECIHKNNVWRAIKKHVNNGNNSIWFVITPANYEFVKTESGIKTSKKKWEKTILERYKWLQKQGQEIQLHVHLRIKMDLYSDEKEKIKDMRNKIEKGAMWLRKNGFEINKVVFGWWSYDKYAEKIAAALNLKVINRLDYYFIHDYDLI